MKARQIWECGECESIHKKESEANNCCTSKSGKKCCTDICRYCNKTIGFLSCFNLRSDGEGWIKVHSKCLMLMQKQGAGAK